MHADYFKCFECSWRDGPRHCCPAKLFVVGCSKDLSIGSKKVQIHCAYTQGCEHHLDDKGRGKSRTVTLPGTSSMTPNGHCRENVGRLHPQTLWSGNKSFGPIDTQSARKYLSRQRRNEFQSGEDPVHSIKIAMEQELSMEEYRKDRFQRNSFYGSIHDLMLTNTGDLRSVSIYCDLGISILARAIEEDPNTTAIIDFTGGIVRDIWLSSI